jgi:ATPase
MRGKMKQKQTISQRIKSKARKNLNARMSMRARTYVIDTSIVINRFLNRLVKKGLKGKIIVPNAVIAELENLANKGNESGFTGLEEIAKLHQYKKLCNLKILFQGIRPIDSHIKYAKSGEIDALIRDIAFKNKAVLITADLVQAKSAQAYGISVLFLKPRKPKKEKKFLFFRKG